MIKNQSTRRLFGLIATTLVASVLSQWLMIPSIQWNDTVMAEGETFPISYDSASSTNFSTILTPRNVDYGIIANNLNQNMHMETTFAAGVFTRSGSHDTDVDFIHGVGYFLIESFGSGEHSHLQLGPSTASDIYIQGPTTVLGDFDPSNPIERQDGGTICFSRNFFRGLNDNGHVPTLHRVDNDSVDVSAIIDRFYDTNTATGQTVTLSNQANNAAYRLPDGFINNGVIDLNYDQFKNQVVYIDVTADLLPYLRQNCGVKIYKHESTVVVFNFDDDITYDNGIYISAIEVYVPADEYTPVGDSHQVEYRGVTYERFKSVTAANGGIVSETYNVADVDSQICQRIIWNVANDEAVHLDSAAGLILAPQSVVDNDANPCCGWIVADTFNVNKEFHFVYQNGSRNMPNELNYTLQKTFTMQWANSTTMAAHPEYSVSLPINAGDYSFNWQQMTDNTFSTPEGNPYNCPVDDSGLAEFPLLAFYTENSSYHGEYLIPTDSNGDGIKTFYFQVTEDQTNPLPGIVYSSGTVNVSLTVTVTGNNDYSFSTSIVSTTGPDTSNLIEYKSETVNINPPVFHIGRFNNLVQPGYLQVTKNLTDGTSPINATAATDFEFAVYEGTNTTGTPYTTITVTVPAGNSTATSAPIAVPQGVYTIVELSQGIIDGYTYDSVSPNSAEVTVGSGNVTTTTAANATFTNTYTSTAPANGYLQVTKNLTDGTAAITVPADTEFTFNVYQGTATTGTPYRTITVTVPQGASTGTSTPIEVPQGSYTVVEATQGTISGYTYASVSPASASVTVDTGNTTTATAATATFTNTYTSTAPATGYLQVTKNLTDGTAAITVPSDTVFTFNVYQGTATTGTPYATITLTVPQGASEATSTPIEVPQGSYTVVEATQGTISGYTYASVSPTSASVTVGTGNTTTATAADASFTNTYTSTAPATGYLQVTKNLTDGTAAITVPSDTAFTFNVYQGTATTGTPYRTITVTVPQGASTGTSTPIEVPQGSYTVVEATQGTISGYTYASVSPASASVTVDTGNTTTATAANAVFTNTYTGSSVATGTLVISKTISGTTLDKLETITFTCIGDQGTTLTVQPLSFTTLGQGANPWTYDSSTGAYICSFTGLNVGETFTVVEVLDGHSSTYELESTTISGPATIASGTVYVDITNTYSPVTNPTQTTPTETTPTDTQPSESSSESTVPTETTASEDAGPVVPQTGCLVISKTISGTALNELEAIVFVLTDTSCGATRDVPALTLANVQNGLWGDAGNGTYYYIVEGLSAGVTYTVTESLDGHTSTYSLDTVNSITTGSAMIVANGTVYVNLTDAYVTGDGTPATEPSSSDETTPTDETSETTAPEVSSVTLDGQPLSPDSYTVNPDGTITLNDAVIRSLGSGDHTIVITYVNGATRTQTVHVDGADRDVAETGETSVNAVAAVVMLSAIVLIYFSKKLRDEAEAEAEN